MAQAQSKYDVLKATSTTLQLGVEDIKCRMLAGLRLLKRYLQGVGAVSETGQGPTRVSMVSAYRFPKRVSEGNPLQSTLILRTLSLVEFNQIDRSLRCVLVVSYMRTKKTSWK